MQSAELEQYLAGLQSQEADQRIRAIRGARRARLVDKRWVAALRKVANNDTHRSVRAEAHRALAALARSARRSAPKGRAKIFGALIGAGIFAVAGCGLLLLTGEAFLTGNDDLLVVLAIWLVAVLIGGWVGSTIGGALTIN